MVAVISWIFVFILYYVGESITQGQNIVNNSRGNDRPTKNGKRISHLDLLMKDLLKQQWATEEIVCQQKVLDILKNVKNSTLWATWIWDSMQSPTGIFYGSRYQLGNYDQCMKAPWLETHSEYRTQYCLADVKLYNEEPQNIIVEPYSSVKSYVNSLSKHGVTFNTITWGVCVPVDCNPKAVTKFVQSLFRQTHLGLTILYADISVDSCQVAGYKKEDSMEYYLLLFILAFAIIVAVTCTTLNSYYGNHLQIDSVGYKFVKALCMKENVASLFKEYKDDIHTMHGIKFLSTSIVIGLHIWFVNNLVGTINPLDVEKDIEKYNLIAVIHADLIVDTYLMMSGLLLTKGVVSSSNHYNPLLLILKRYLRFVCMIGLLALFIMQVLLRSGDGPLWPRIIEKEVQICKKTWWLTLLMLGNYVDTANICYPILWTVPCDFHLSIVGVIIIWLMKKNRRIAFATFTVLMIAAITLPGVVTYQQRLPAVPPFNNLRSIKDFRNDLFKNPTYLWSHLRAGSYLTGLAVGYLMTTYKPDKHRNVIPKAYSVIGFIIALATAMQIMMMGGIFQELEGPYNVWVAALFASFNRTIWAIAMACLIAICEYGTVPIIGPFLKSELFLPLSKLSYGTYLLHMVIFSRAVISTRTPLNHDMFLMSIHTYGVLGVCIISSLLLFIFFEAPMSKIINIMFDMKKIKNDCKMKEHECKNNNIHPKQKKTL